MKKLSIITLSIVLVFLFLTCNNQGGGGSSTATIGPEGGTITSSDGRLTLTFPPGALSEDTEITIRKIDPNDLPPEFDGLDPELAYLLEPDGIVFAVPVTASLMLDEEPVQEDGTLQTEGALLLTSSDGELEVLENLTQDVDGGADTTTVSGELSHFTLLVQFRYGIAGGVIGVPDVIAPGEIFNVEAFVEPPQKSGPALTVNPVTYRDDSILQIKCLEDNCEVKLDLTTLPGLFKLEMKYVCVEPPEGIYESEILVPLKDGNPNDSIKVDFLAIFNFSKPVKCPSASPSPTPTATPPPTPPPPPTPTPTPTPSPSPTPTPMSCPLSGTYSSVSAGCGINTFTLFHDEGGFLSCTDFGDNMGTVTFLGTNDPEVFRHDSPNIKILNVDGHTCVITCGPGSNQVTLTCNRPGAMCTEVFSRVF